MHNKTLLLLLAIISLTITFSTSVFTQEVNCTIKVNFESVPTTNKDLLVNFEADVRDYVNNYKWGPDVLDERINCTMDIFIKSVVGENRYSAQVFVGSQRPIFEGLKNSAVVRIFDEAWEFTYVQNRPIIHNNSFFNDLASFLDFYVFLVIGYDYDTYISLSGTPYFQKSADISNLARSTGGKGWQASTGSGYSRLLLIDEILNTKFAPVRAASFNYHFAGLDSMNISPSTAYKNIEYAIMMIGEVKKTADPRTQIIKTFFDTKYLELAELFIGYSDQKIFMDLSRIDPAHQTTYEEYRKKTK